FSNVASKIVYRLTERSAALQLIKQMGRATLVAPVKICYFLKKTDRSLVAYLNFCVKGSDY
ncbi:MAG: hypothetical protein AAGI45_16625, partial [Cyanobacteria bacterium P01_H01_bin.26]